MCKRPRTTARDCSTTGNRELTRPWHDAHTNPHHYVCNGSQNEPARAGKRCARSGASGEVSLTNLSRGYDGSGPVLRIEGNSNLRTGDLERMSPRSSWLSSKQPTSLIDCTETAPAGFPEQENYMLARLPNQTKRSPPASWRRSRAPDSVTTASPRSQRDRGFCIQLMAEVTCGDYRPQEFRQLLYQ